MYSGKHKNHGIKYQGICDLGNGKFKSWLGPFYGSIHDKLIFDSTFGNNFPIKMLGDKAYYGASNIYVPFKGKNLTLIQEDYNKFISKNRIIIERSFGRLKNFRILQYKYKGLIENHKHIANVLVQIHNILLEFRPLINNN